MHFECVKLSVDDDGNDEEVDEALCSFGHLPKVPVCRLSIHCFLTLDWPVKNMNFDCPKSIFSSFNPATFHVPTNVNSAIGRRGVDAMSPAMAKISLLSNVIQLSLTIGLLN